MDGTGQPSSLPSRRNAITAESLVNESANSEINENEASTRPLYWCHACQMQVLVRVIDETKEIECIACSNSFVEEMDENNIVARREQRTQNRDSLQNRLMQQMMTSMAINADLPGIIRQFVSSLQGQNNDQVAVYIQGSLPGMLDLGSLGGLAGNVGDYHFGSSAALDTLLHQLMQADQNNRGTLPASQEVRENLPKIKISEAQVDQKLECAVCKDVFELHATCAQLPCSHLFCPGCIEPWLKEHNTCPVCRKELPTDDPEYERMRKEREKSAEAGTAPQS
mmetsp:Transcript_6526/g.7466  ORF Transcript_6526/g.7466 Transcript_6526/m.7466 type:complete len:281 (+) Transcript_6526:384-1226(+)|eukprot:CAMPEP_0184023424 /NCGR_PEP_ID=MMETSP0954-20121128/11354_1 /TAXON_ID=627963 /ORGANISM="Aplanochytrium sp, Strain PBS07" /LENGTH=280 /DNA_ID=CAMNT_0026306309 /DNA_START=335 /DNA_END=1177 /DNA_ORIENTATION=-